MKQLLAHLKGLKKKNVVNTKPYMIRIVHITKQPKGAGCGQGATKHHVLNPIPT